MVAAQGCHRVYQVNRNLGRGEAMSEREIVVTVKELNRMEISSPSCQTEVLFDVANTAHIPTRCSSCGKDFAEDMCTLIRSYRNFFQKADEAIFKFSIKEA